MNDVQLCLDIASTSGFLFSLPVEKHCKTFSTAIIRFRSFLHHFRSSSLAQQATSRSRHSLKIYLSSSSSPPVRRVGADRAWGRPARSVLSLSRTHGRPDCQRESTEYTWSGLSLSKTGTRMGEGHQSISFWSKSAAHCQLRKPVQTLSYLSFCNRTRNDEFPSSLT